MKGVLHTYRRFSFKYLNVEGVYLQSLDSYVEETKENEWKAKGKKKHS